MLSLLCPLTAYADYYDDPVAEPIDVTFNFNSGGYDYLDVDGEYSFGDVIEDVPYRTLVTLQERVYEGSLAVQATGAEFNVYPNYWFTGDEYRLWKVRLDLNYDLLVGGPVASASCVLGSFTSVFLNLSADGVPSLQVPMVLQNGTVGDEGITIPTTCTPDGVNTIVHSQLVYVADFYTAPVDLYTTLSFILSGDLVTTNIISGSRGVLVYRYIPSATVYPYHGPFDPWIPDTSWIPGYTIPPLDIGIPELLPLVSEALAVTKGTSDAMQRFWGFFLSYTFSPYTYYLGASVALSFIVYSVLKDTKHKE